MAYKKATVQNNDDDDRYRKYKKPSEYDLVNGSNGNEVKNDDHSDVNPGIANSIEKECGPEMAKAILRMTCNNFTDRTAVLSTTSIFNIKSLIKERYDYIINLHKINDIQKFDKFLDAVNSKLEMKGFFFCVVETKDRGKSVC